MKIITLDAIIFLTSLRAMHELLSRCFYCFFAPMTRYRLIRTFRVVSYTIYSVPVAAEKIRAIKFKGLNKLALFKVNNLNMIFLIVIIVICKVNGVVFPLSNVSMMTNLSTLNFYGLILVLSLQTLDIVDGFLACIVHRFPLISLRHQAIDAILIQTISPLKNFRHSWLNLVRTGLHL